MSLQTRPSFPHRYNRDGSYDSICSACFVTVASVRNEEELEICEDAHICSPTRLQQLNRYPVLAGSAFDLLR